MTTKEREMTKDELAVFVVLQKTPAREIEPMYQYFKKKSWVLEAIEKHCNALEMEVAKSVQIMVHCHADGIIGQAVKYLQVIHEWAMKEKRKEVTLDDYAMKIFPHGIPDFTA